MCKRVRFPDRPASSKSVYLLSYPVSKVYLYMRPSPPILVAARSKTCVSVGLLAGMAGSNPAGSVNVCCECCVLSSRGFYDGLIPRPEKIYRVYVSMSVIRWKNNPLYLQ